MFGNANETVNTKLYKVEIYTIQLQGCSSSWNWKRQTYRLCFCSHDQQLL